MNTNIVDNNNSNYTPPQNNALKGKKRKSSSEHLSNSYSKKIKPINLEHSLTLQQNYISLFVKACESQFSNIAKNIFKENKLNPNWTTSTGDSLLHIAIKHRMRDLVSLLFNNGAIIYQENSS